MGPWSVGKDSAFNIGLGARTLGCDCWRIRLGFGTLAISGMLKCARVTAPKNGAVACWLTSASISTPNTPSR